MGSGCPPAPPHPGSCRFPHPPRQPPSALAEEAPATSLHRRFWSHGMPGCNNGVALPRGCSPGPGDGAGLQHLGLPKTSSSQAKPGFRGAGGAEQGGAQGQAGWAGGGCSLFLHPWVLRLAGTRDPKHWHLLLSPQHIRETCLCRDTCING